MVNEKNKLNSSDGTLKRAQTDVLNILSSDEESRIKLNTIKKSKVICANNWSRFLLKTEP